jgi:hypothetical protein
VTLQAGGITASLEFPANLYGSCSSVNVLKSFASACSSTLNETACKASKICEWNAIESSESESAGSCDFAPTGKAELLFSTTASTAFNDAVAKVFTEGRAAENATQCAAVGTKQIDESKVTEALAFVQAGSAKRAAAAASVRPLLHLFMGAVSVAGAWFLNRYLQLHARQIRSALCTAASCSVTVAVASWYSGQTRGRGLGCLSCAA